MVARNFDRWLLVDPMQQKDLDCHLGVKKRGKAGNGSLRDQRAMGALAVNLD